MTECVYFEFVYGHGCMQSMLFRSVLFGVQLHEFIEEILLHLVAIWFPGDKNSFGDEAVCRRFE